MTDAIKSNTYHGLIVAIAGPLLARYGISDEQTALIVEGLSLLVGAALTIWGRQHATGPVTHVATLPLPRALIPSRYESVPYPGGKDSKTGPEKL